MLKQNKTDNDTCKLFESHQTITAPPQQIKAYKGKNNIDWGIFLAETAKAMLPSFSQEHEDKAAEKAISYAKALILKLKESL